MSHGRHHQYYIYTDQWSRAGQSNGPIIFSAPWNLYPSMYVAEKHAQSTRLSFNNSTCSCRIRLPVAARECPRSARLGIFLLPMNSDDLVLNREEGHRCQWSWRCL